MSGSYKNMLEKWSKKLKPKIKPEEKSIVWITGNTGAGKTTLAKEIQKKYPNTIVLDGDELRTAWELGFSEEDRWAQNLRVARLANILNEQGFHVVVSTICPYKQLRESITDLYNPEWINLNGGRKASEKYPYES